MEQNKIVALFPLLGKINDPDLKTKVVKCWEESILTGGWDIDQLDTVPFTLLIEGTKTSLIEHTNNVTRMAVSIAETLSQSYSSLKIDMDLIIAGALLHDVAKLMEYDRKDGKVVKSHIGQYLRHPIGGAALAAKNGLPDEIVHVIGSHSKEGSHAKRMIEAIIIHHADFLNFEPFIT